MSDLSNKNIIVDEDAGSSGLEDDGITSFNLQSGDVSINSGQIEITGSFSSSLPVEQDSDDLTNVGLRLAGCIDRPTSSLTSSLAIFDLTGDEGAVPGTIFPTSF